MKKLTSVIEDPTSVISVMTLSFEGCSIKGCPEDIKKAEKWFGGKVHWWTKRHKKRTLERVRLTLKWAIDCNAESVSLCVLDTEKDYFAIAKVQDREIDLIFTFKREADREEFCSGFEKNVSSQYPIPICQL